MLLYYYTITLLSTVELADSGWGLREWAPRLERPDRAKIASGSASRRLDRAKIALGGVPSRSKSALDRSWSDSDRSWGEFGPSRIDFGVSEGSILVLLWCFFVRVGRLARRRADRRIHRCQR